MTGKTAKIEHVLKGWEKKYGYLGLLPTERDFFSPVKGKRFTLKILGNELYERKIDDLRRIYVSKVVFRDVEVGDVLVFHRDEKGNYTVEKRES